jgi:hypothetical protein
MPDTIDMLAYVPLFGLLDDEERAALPGYSRLPVFPRGSPSSAPGMWAVPCTWSTWG